MSKAPHYRMAGKPRGYIEVSSEDRDSSEDSDTGTYVRHALSRNRSTLSWNNPLK